MNVLFIALALLGGVEPEDVKYIEKTYNVALSQEAQDVIKHTLASGGRVHINLGKITFESNDDFSPMEFHINDTYFFSLNNAINGTAMDERDGDITPKLKKLHDSGKLNFSKFTVTLKVRSFTKENREKIKFGVEKINFSVRSVIKTEEK